MPQSIRFHLDEHSSTALAEGLRRRGVEVTTTIEAALTSATDAGQLAYALRHGRVIFTQDEDFLRLHAAGVEHSGIIYCRQQTRSLGDMIRGLLLIWDIYEPVEMHNRFEYL